MFCDHNYEINFHSSLRPPNVHTETYEVRSASGQQWQHIVFCYSEKQHLGYYPISRSKTSSTAYIFDPCLCYQIIRPSSNQEKTNTYKNVRVDETLLIDEVDKKLYFIHFPVGNPNYVVREASVHINKQNQPFIESPHSVRVFLGRLDFKINLRRTKLTTDEQIYMIKWFMNPFDGNIFLIHSYMYMNSPCANYHTVSWLKLDDSVSIESPSGLEYNGKVKVIAQCNFEFNKLNYLESVVFSKNGKIMLLRFRLDHPADFGLRGFENTDLYQPDRDANLATLDPDSPYVSHMTKPPVYVLLGLDSHSKSIEVLTQFDPSSYEHHCNLLVTSRLLSTFGDYVGLPNTAATSFLSQRTRIIGQFFKYTFFSALHKQKLAILGIKSLDKTLLNGHLSLTPKKMWFPLEDEKVKERIRISRIHTCTQKTMVRLCFLGIDSI